MIKVDEVNVMSIQLQDDDVNMFVGIVTRLIVEARKPGFKKMFSQSETEFLYELAENMGIEIKGTDVNIHVPDALVK